MLRLTPQGPGWTLGASVMMDLSLGRYLGFDGCPSVGALRARIAALEPETLANGIHLIVVQCADGSLIVGDSHHYASTPDPFSYEAIDALILDEFRSALGIEPPPTIERWIGTYASAADRPVLIDAPEPSVRIAIVPCAAGAPTGFAIGEEVIASLFDVVAAP